MTRCNCGRLGTIESIHNEIFCDLCARHLDHLYFNWRMHSR